MSARRSWFFGVVIAMSLLVTAEGAANECPEPDGWDDGLAHDTAGPNGYGHTAVWTGSRMIVWGGYDSERFWSNGGLYDPLTDSWRPMARGNAPSGRAGHQAIWTGKFMVIWGGGSRNDLKDGSRYDPVSDTWLHILPPAWLEDPYSAVGAGREVLVAGARGSHGLYDPAGDSWRPVSPMGAPESLVRYGSGGSVWTGEEVLLWDWRQSADGRHILSHRYNPAIDTWSPISEEEAPVLIDSRLAWVGHEMMVWGIRRLDDGTLVGEGAKYDPAVDRWTPISKVGAPPPLIYGTMISTGREAIAWGGCPYRGPEADCTNTGARYDPADDSWSPTITDGAPPVVEATAVWANGVMLLYGHVQQDYDDPGWPQVFTRGGRYYPVVRQDDDGDGFTVCEGDCDDENASVNPSVPELPGNSLDEDCDGLRACDPASGWRSRGQLVACIVRDCHEKAKAGLISKDGCLAAASESQGR